MKLLYIPMALIKPMKFLLWGRPFHSVSGAPSHSRQGTPKAKACCLPPSLGKHEPSISLGGPGGTHIPSPA